MLGAARARVVAKLLFWPLLAVVSFLALHPRPPLVAAEEVSAYLQHALAFATLAAIGVVAWGLQLKVIVRLIAVGIALELGQIFSPGRHVDLVDLLANIAGIALAIALVRAWTMMQEKDV